MGNRFWSDLAWQHRRSILPFDEINKKKDFGFLFSNLESLNQGMLLKVIY